MAATFPTRATGADANRDNGARNHDWGNATNWVGKVLPATGLGTIGDKNKERVN